MRKLSQRERLIAGVTATVAVGALVYLYAIEPAAAAWLEVHDRAEEAQHEAQDLKSLIQDKDNIELEYRKLRGAVAQAASEEELTIALLREVDQLAAGCGLQISSAKPLQVSRGQNFDRIAMELQAYGNANQAVQFLQRLQSEEHLLTTDSITMLVGRGEAPVTVTLHISKLAAIGKRKGP